MPTGSAGEDPDIFETLPDSVGESHVFQMNPIGIQRKSTENRVLDGDWLFVDFLQHEMLVAALLRHDRVPRDVLELGLAAVTSRIKQPNTVLTDYGDLMIIEKQNRSRVWQHRRNIRRDETFAIDGAYDQGIALADGDNFLRVIHADARKRIEAFEFS